MYLFFIFTFFSFKKFLFVLPYKELLEAIWEIFSVGLIVLDNLCEVFGYFIITSFILAMFGFSKVFGC